MSVGNALISGLIGGVFGAASSILKKKPKTPAPVPVQTVNQAAEEAQKRDVLSRRRTPAADMLLGAGGAESSTGTKTSLGA